MSDFDHAREAERLLRDADEAPSMGMARHLVAHAQAHATLALAQRVAEIGDVLETRSLSDDLVRR